MAYTYDPAAFLKYANLQMAAEAFLVDGFGKPYLVAKDYIDALITGNKHASRFTDTEAKAFSDQWEVVDQIANTPSGFSGTLFKCKVTDPTKGLVKDQFVISFRSTEFVDDAVRDNQATIKKQALRRLTTVKRDD